MKFGESEVIRSEGSCNLLKIGARGDREVYCVITEAFNLCWMQEKFG